MLLFDADAVAADIAHINNIIAASSMHSSQLPVYLLADSPSSKLVYVGSLLAQERFGQFLTNANKALVSE